MIPSEELRAAAKVLRDKDAPLMEAQADKEPRCRICRERPIYCKEQCRRCYDRNWARERRAHYPIRECAACHRERPIQRYGWCESCVTRWQKAGRPAGGPPPLMDPDELRKLRQRIALEGRLSQALTAAIRRGGWEWAA